MNRLLTLILILLATQVSYSQMDSSKSLVTETMLHPGDAFTGYVYKKGEWGYNQAITPYPSWAWWGITNSVTAEVDLEAWLGGVPSFNFRVGVIDNDGWKPAIAFETMYQYLGEQRDQFHNLEYLEINRQGSNWYNHINLSWQLKHDFHLHVSGGSTYAQHLSISNADSTNNFGEKFDNKFHPDYSVGLDWKFSKWMTLHSTTS